MLATDTPFIIHISKIKKIVLSFEELMVRFLYMFRDKVEKRTTQAKRW